MAAAIRLCGRALRRTQQPPRVSEQHRQLFTRTRATTAEEQKEVAARLEQIDEKKEELYDMIFHIVNNRYKVPRKTYLENNLLLERLSVQVKPRPNDAHWRSCRRTEKYNRFLINVGAHSVGFASPFVLYWMVTGTWPRRKRWYEE